MSANERQVPAGLGEPYIDSRVQRFVVFQVACCGIPSIEATPRTLKLKPRPNLNQLGWERDML